MDVSDLKDLPDDFDKQAMVRCVQFVRDGVEHPERLRYSIVSDFNQGVRDVVEDKAYAEAYEQSRPLAHALAKTIPLSDGTIHLVVDAAVFLKSQPCGPPDDLFEHELCHIQHHERGEDLHGLRTRDPDRIYSVPADLVAMAGIAAEEFRVETCLRTRNRERSNPHQPGFELTCRIFYRGVREVCQQYQRDQKLDPLIQGVLEYFHALATSSGYVAAELAAVHRGPLDIVLPLHIETVILGKPWRTVIERLQDFPDAGTPTPRAELEPAVIALAEALQRWLRYIGFDYANVEDGRMKFMLDAPQRWHVPMAYFEERYDGAPRDEAQSA